MVYAVSYTHLDVYKRQDDTICTIAVADAINTGANYKDKFLQCCRAYPNPKGAYGGSFARWIASDNPQPVSYTHLIPQSR